MANDLTGHFDVVAQFAIPAANRFLAAMHGIQRFPHSMSLDVDDTPPRPGHVKPTVVGIIDSFGDPTVKPENVRRPDLLTGDSSATSHLHTMLDGIVNIDVVDVGIEFVPSNFKGRAQLQLSPPALEIPDASGSRVRVRMQMMSRYFPDPNTDPLAEFARGELQLTASVTQTVSAVANVIEIGINTRTAEVQYTPAWSSRPFSAQDLFGVNLVIRNALKSSFLPSSTTLPPEIRSMQFKTLAAPQSAIAALLKLTDGPRDPGTMNQVFLASGDDFGVAVGVEFIRESFRPTIDQILSKPVPNVSFDIDGFVYTWHITYRVVLNSAEINLEAGKIVLTIRGRATTSQWPPNFDFTVRQEFTLGVDGTTANLEVRNLSFDTSSWIIDLFKGGATSAIAGVRDQALADGDAYGVVRRMLDVHERLGSLLRSLLTPPNQEAPPQTPGYQLRLTAADIRPAGIILRGSLSLSDWAPPHVEFEEISPATSGPIGGPIDTVASGPEYSAFKSWIPGGLIESFDWRPQGLSQPGSIDTDKFVRLPPEPEVSAGIAAATIGYTSFCLRIRGRRLTASGQVRPEAVNGTVCGHGSFPIVNDFSVAAGNAVPMISLARPAADGSIDIVGHTPAGIGAAGYGLPNLIVHFADENSAGQLQRLTDSLRESKRTDAPTAIVAVLMRDQLERARYTPDVIYSEDQDGAWQRLLGVRPARPSTFIVGPKGTIVWQQEGEVETGSLVDALRKTLVRSRPVMGAMTRPRIRIGHLPPNFLFEYAPDHDLTLRKLAGRSVVLVFWKSTSRASIDAVRELNGRQDVVLAINDGEEPDAARRAAATNNLTATIVTDPKRSISRAYGVATWPTIVAIDPSGIVRTIQTGRIPPDRDRPPIGERYASVQQEQKP